MRGLGYRQGPAGQRAFSPMFEQTLRPNLETTYTDSFASNWPSRPGCARKRGLDFRPKLTEAILGLYDGSELMNRPVF